jgi:hypothetical protein
MPRLKLRSGCRQTQLTGEVRASNDLEEGVHGIDDPSRRADFEVASARPKSVRCNATVATMKESTSSKTELHSHIDAPTNA